jgi:hypothetical protein
VAGGAEFAELVPIFAAHRGSGRVLAFFLQLASSQKPQRAGHWW